MMQPRKFRQLPPALPATNADILPISQVDPETGLASTRAMTHGQFQADLVQAVDEARADLVAGFTATIEDIQAHQDWIDIAVQQIEDMDTALQDAITVLEGKVDHPTQWTDITGKPSTFPPSTHGHVIGDVTGLQTAIDSAAATPVAPTWSTLSGKPSTFPPVLPISWTDVSSKPTTFTPSTHSHVISDVTNLQTSLDAKLNTPTVSTPTRILGTAFQPSTTRPTLVVYSVKTTVTNPLLAGASTAMVQLMSDSATTPTTVRADVAAESSVGLAVAIAITTSNTATLAYIVPANHYVRLVSTTTGTATTSIIRQTEITL